MSKTRMNAFQPITLFRKAIAVGRAYFRVNSSAISRSNPCTQSSTNFTTLFAQGATDLLSHGSLSGFRLTSPSIYRSDHCCQSLTQFATRLRTGTGRIDHSRT
jgi:hypothetical protein